MNCNKSQLFLEKWEENSTFFKRKLTEFSLQLTPSKFSDMINYKKIVMENLEPSDFEYDIYSDGKEVYQHITDSKMKSLCLKKAKPIIEKLEFSAKNPDEVREIETKAKLFAFINGLSVSNKAFGTSVSSNLDEKIAKVCVNDMEICGLSNAKYVLFDVLTFSEGYNHTFVLRYELENGDMYSFYSQIGRDGVKGEKPQVFASCFIDGYYVMTKTEHKIY